MGQGPQPCTRLRGGNRARAGRLVRGPLALHPLYFSVGSGSRPDDRRVPAQRRTQGAFWLFNFRLLLAALLAFVVSLVFCGGLSAIIASLDFLFEIKIPDTLLACVVDRRLADRAALRTFACADAARRGGGARSTHGSDGRQGCVRPRQLRARSDHPRLRPDPARLCGEDRRHDELCRKARSAAW